MNPLLNVAVKAARRAGALLVRYQDRLEKVKIEDKGRNDFVTEVDRMAEEDIVDTIHYLYPNHTILAEESGSDKSPTGEEVEDEYQWIIDPLDGTANYIHGQPHFCVSIALKWKGQLECGVVFDPLREELFTATRGHGAQLNSRRIRVSGQGRLGRSSLAAEFPTYQPDRLNDSLKVFKAMVPRVANVRCSGSAALNLAYVAAGRLEGYWQDCLDPWDMAAGALLVREAGGLVSDHNGSQDYLENGSIVSGNLQVFNELLTSIKKQTNKAA